MKKTELNNHLKNIIRYLCGDASKEEIEAVQKWRKINTSNERYFNQIEIIWKNSKYLKDFNKINIEKNWQELIKETPGLEKYKVRENKGKVRFLYAKIAAASVILFFISLTIYKFNNSKWITIKSNEKQELLLNDGSKVFLNKNTELQYPKTFSNNIREVILDGEAYFEIEHNPSEPFMIRAKQSTIKVLGTKFNINSKPDKSVTVSVVSGKIAFYQTADASQYTELTKGQQGTYNPNVHKINTTKFDDNNFLSWKTGVFQYKNQTISRVFEDFEKYYNTTILVQDSNIYNNTLTSTYNNQDLATILNELSILYNITYSIKPDTVILRKE